MHSIAARVHTRIVKFRESYEAKVAGRDREAGLEAIEVVVLSVVALGIVVALGALIKGLVDSYSGDLVRKE